MTGDRQLNKEQKHLNDLNKADGRKKKEKLKFYGASSSFNFFDQEGRRTVSCRYSPLRICSNCRMSAEKTLRYIVQSI